MEIPESELLYLECHWSLESRGQAGVLSVTGEVARRYSVSVVPFPCHDASLKEGSIVPWVHWVVPVRRLVITLTALSPARRDRCSPVSR